VTAITVVVGSGGVGKTTLAAVLGVLAARSGRDALVMTFDPSLRLKDTLGVGEAAKDAAVEVHLEARGRLSASLLDARQTFDRLVARYAPDRESRDRILNNRFYDNLSGSLAGVLEYMAVEKLFEVVDEDRHDAVILDTPPTRQALAFLDAPDRIVGFLDSGALRIALRQWFDESGSLRPTRRLGFLGKSVESFFDNVIGLDLLRDMNEFFRAFAPLYDGFRRRALEVKELLSRRGTEFVLVSSPAQEAVPDTMFLARKLLERDYSLGPVVANRVHPLVPAENLRESGRSGGRGLFAWLGERDAAGVAQLRTLLGRGRPLAAVPLLADEPASLPALEALATTVAPMLEDWRPWEADG